MRMVYNVAVTYNSSYTGQIDVLSLEHEYWSRPFVSQLIYGNPNQSPTTADYDAAFANHLEIMDYMEWVRCFNQRLILESEENLKGSNITKSKLDQAIDIDSRYFNRLLLVDYYNDPDKLLDVQCERLQIFGDSHTDHYTVIWPLFSAEGDNLPEIFCDGTHSSTNVLGNTFLGNILYAQTKTLSDCETTHETDYTAAMVSGNTGSNCPSGWTGGDNIIGGYMWFSSKQLMGYHALPRLSKPDAGNHAVDGHAEVIYPNPSAGQLYMEFLSDNPKTVTLYNANGQIIITDSFVSKTYNLDISGYAKGIYYLMLKDSNGSILKNEIVLN